jgi:hypothetical protein
MSVDYSTDQYADAIRAEYRGDLGGGMGSMGGGIAWMAVVLVSLPVVAFLVLVGVIYEIVIRLGRHQLPSFADWTVSLLAAVALVGVGGVALVHLVWPG